MASKKLKILLVWGYHRKGWIEPFEKLKNDFDFVYMHYLQKPEKEVKYTDCPTYYWMDYKNPYQLLDSIQPDRVVFMGIDRSNSMALNMVCKHKKIQTFVLQHGVFYSYQWYLDNNKKEIDLFKKSGEKWGDELEAGQQMYLLKFLFGAIRWNFLAAIPFCFKFLILKKYHGKNLQRFIKSLNSRKLIPYKYLVFTRENSQFFVERNRAIPSDFHEIGNPFLDEYFDVPDLEKGDYYLLIDEPLAYINDFNSDGFFSKEVVIEYQKKLNQFAKSQGKKLIIKLHPYSYNNDFYFQDENITYLEDADIPSLIHRALGVFGTSSTLLIPSVFVNKCVIFNIWEFSEFELDCEKWELIQKLDFHKFEPEDINFDSFSKKEENLQKMIAKYLYKIDGKATERLKQAFIKIEE